MRQDKETRGQGDKGRNRPDGVCVRLVSLSPCLLVPLSCLAVGCQQKMAEQPSYRPYQPSRLLKGGTSAQRPPDGTVAREWPRSSDPLTTGLRPGSRGSPAPAGEKARPGTPPPDAPSDPGKFADAFPFELTRADLDRGQERYTIFCAVCHDPVGTGGGKIPERGYVKPPNFHTDASRGFALYRITVPLREVPVGYVFEVITRGYGAMPRYGPQVPPKDRWRIAAYVRALQLSQHAEVESLPPAARESVRQSLGGTP